MLLSQGWTPGSYLGAVNAPHAHLHSDASASHIRITLKDDNLGVGAKHGSGQAAGECTGLDSFQGLLGRLNGKSNTELEKEQKSRDDFKRATYTERRWGVLRFVSGGTLIGDRIRELADREKSRLVDITNQPTSVEKSEQQELALTHGTKSTANAARTADHTGKRPKVNPAEGISSYSSTKATRPHSTVQRQEEKVVEEMDRPNVDFQLSDKARRKAEKLERKLDRRKRKEAKRASRSQPVQPGSSSNIMPTQQINFRDPEKDSSSDCPSATNTPASAVSIGVVPAVGRHIIRQRYIKQKKLATMDPKALNEILMIKAQ
ncbi:MAG: hypothetical protein Q9187_001598 [Circinaria calcarea]